MTNPEADPAVVAAVERRILGSLEPVRPMFAARYFQLAFFLLFGAVSLAGSLAFDNAGFFALAVPPRFAVFGLLTTAGWVSSEALAAEMTPGSLRAASRGWLFGGAFSTLALGAALIMPFGDTNHLVALGLPCLKLGTSAAICAALLAGLILRFGAVTGERSAQIAAATFSGVTAATVLQLHCDREYFFHILVWHLGPFPIAAILLAGAPVAWRTFRKAR